MQGDRVMKVTEGFGFPSALYIYISEYCPIYVREVRTNIIHALRA